MKKSSIVSFGMLLAALLMLSGCLFPVWEDEGGGRGGHHDGGRGGHHDGGDRR